MDTSFGIGMVFRARDMAGGVVHGLEGRMKSLAGVSDRASRRFARSMDRMRAGLKLMAGGGAVLGAMGLLVRSTVASQRALGEMGSLGYRNFNALDKAATQFTNKWAGYNKAQFITAAYDIKSGIESLSDEGVAAYTRMAVLTAKATKASASEMTKLFALIYGVYKDSYKKMSDLDFGRMVSGGISAAVRVFRTDGRDLVQGISNIGRAAAGMGVKFHEQLAILGVAKGAYNSAAEAGTGYRAFLTTVLKAQKALGMSFTDAQGRLLPFVNIMKKIEAKFGDLSQAKAQLALQKAFGSAEAVRFLMAFTGKTTYLTAKLRELKGAMKGGMAVTVEMAKAMNMRIGDVLQLFGQRMHNMFESIGKTLLPVVIPIVNAVGKVITAVQKFASENPRLVGAITRIVFAVGGLVFALGAGAVAWHFFGRYARFAMASIAKTFLPVSLAVGALIGIIYLVRKAWKSNFGGIATTLTKFWNKVKLVWEGISQLIGSFTGRVGTMSADLADKLKKAGLFKFVVGAFKLFARLRFFVVGLFRGIWSAIKDVGRWAWESFGVFWRAIKPVVQWLGRMLRQLGLISSNTTLGGVKSVGVTVGKVTGYVIAGVIGWKLFRKAIVLAKFALKGFKVAIWAAKAAVIGTKIVIGGLTMVLKGMRLALIAVGVARRLAFGWIGVIIAGLVAVAMLVVKYWDDIVGAVRGALNWIGWVASTVWDAIKIGAKAVADFFVMVWNKPAEAAAEVWKAIVGAVKWAWGVIKSVGTAIGDFFSGVWNKVSEVAGNIWQGIKNTVTGVLTGIVDIAKRIFAGMLKIVLAPIKGVLWIASAFSSRAGRAYDRIKAWEDRLTGQGRKVKVRPSDQGEGTQSGWDSALGSQLTMPDVAKRARDSFADRMIAEVMAKRASRPLEDTGPLRVESATSPQDQQAGLIQLAAAMAEMAKRPVVVQIDGREVARVVADRVYETARRSLGL